MPSPTRTVSDDEVALSMLVFMQDYGAARILKATAEACKMFGKQQTNKGDWYEAANLVSEAANIAEYGNPNKG